jgi:uncharacterized membrane protein YfcA
MGFIVGDLSGFFGFGGGFIITPFLLTLGIPANVAVGTSIVHIFASSILATLRHMRLGHVDTKLGLIIAAGSIVGTECGAQLLEFLKKFGLHYLDFSVSIVYALVLSSICFFTSYDAYKSIAGGKSSQQRALANIIRRIQAPPLVSVSHSNITPISLWAILLIGLLVGLISGFTGAGGGFVLVPLLMYVVGCRPVIAVGTSIFGVLLGCVSASISHTIKDNVDLPVAALMFAGSSVGSR